VIDPGPDLGAHVDAIVDALEPGEARKIVITHALDHSPATPALRTAPTPAGLRAAWRFPTTILTTAGVR
jgi:hypothetical protein